MPAEGEVADRVTAGRLMHDDVVTVSLTERIGTAQRLIDESPYGYALVVSADATLLGRLRRSACDDPDATAESVMEPGPSTVRPDTPADELAMRLRDRGLKTAIVTTPEGRPLGVLSLRELEAAGGKLEAAGG